ncbi:hypothetical protein CGCS363_v006288 [Colletotrichum siamense]|uniref:uncharacterized protein n=1 Tax=Colletotrichum siamense TaxID=690259 RepID=UPI001872F560|nr:uncharacterized protein CGCS363_v006288 [Colletotrichum siamense]KAF5501580.1 hypothetical protein CGCS363_v006288 [Colletotrichum siamense]
MSFAVFGLYCWFLNSWDGYRVCYWNERVPHVFSSFYVNNLGSAASSIITVLKILSFIPITAAMGQLKWHYFLRRYSRPVAELETFDAASRGVSGSIKLLVSGRRFHSIHITLGCLLTLDTLYLGSSTQNTITSPSRVYWPLKHRINETTVALLPVTEMFNVTARRDIIGVDTQNYSEDPGMQAALFTAWSFYENPLFANQEIDQVSANCSSTYCRWHNTTTLSMAVKCCSAATTFGRDGHGYSKEADIASSIDVITNGLSTRRQAIINLRASPKIPENSGFNRTDRQRAVIIHLAAIAEHDEQSFDAAECLIFWTAAHVSETVYHNNSGSTLTQTVASIQSIPENRTSTEDESIVFKAPCSGKRNTETCSFKITNDANLTVRKLLTDFMTGYVYRDPNQNGTLFIPSSTVMDLFAWSWRTTLVKVSMFPNPLTTTLEVYMLNTIYSLSGYIRTKQATQLEGQNGSFEPIFHIEWKYTIYPGAMLILTLYLFAFTVWATRSMPVWKSSLLLYLFHGFDRLVLDSRYDLSSLPWMEEFSKEKKVVLRDADDGLGLKLRDMDRGTSDEGF